MIANRDIIKAQKTGRLTNKRKLSACSAFFVGRYSILARRCYLVVNNGVFTAMIIAVILLASLIVGIDTYDIPGEEAIITFA